jgi:hypothetical protein
MAHHVVQRHREGRIEAEDRHPERVSHEDRIHAGLVDQARGRSVVGGDHDDSLTRGLARAQGGDGDGPLEAAVSMDAHERPPLPM